MVISGAARGADHIAARVAFEEGFDVVEFPAQWKKFGRKAGPIRNQQMLDEGKPTFVFAFSLDILQSKGTLDMVTRATQAGVPVVLFNGREYRMVKSVGSCGIIMENPDEAPGPSPCICPRRRME